MGKHLGTENRPLRVAIVGAGPSGFYAAEALLSAPIKIQVDMFERLPTPFGLVRYGVAPDHPRIKDVVKVYELIAANDDFTYFGYVNIGTDLTVEELKRFYDAIIFACGTDAERKLGIPGEDLPGCHSATEFVAWYNGHPEYADRQFNLKVENAVIIGVGNVALDVARILCKSVDELKHTDITQQSLDVLSESQIKEIHLIGRRGPMQASFTPQTIKEFGELQKCVPVVDSKSLELNKESELELQDPANAQRRKNYEILKEFSQRSQEGAQRRLIIHFLKSPVEIQGKGKVEKVKLVHNTLVGDPGKQKAKPTEKTEEIPCGMFFRSVGYRGVPIEGVPFDDERGLFPNDKGRITREGAIVLGFYCAGWIKRGPFGVIGSNKSDSRETVQNLLEDVPKLQPCPSPQRKAVLDYITKKTQKKPVSFPDWRKIDLSEKERGKELNKPREKYVVIKEMLDIIR